MSSAVRLAMWVKNLKMALIHHCIFENSVIDCCSADTSMVYFLMENFETVGSGDIYRNYQMNIDNSTWWKATGSLYRGIITRPPNDHKFIKSMIDHAITKGNMTFCAVLVQYPYSGVLKQYNPTFIIEVSSFAESVFVWAQNTVKGLNYSLKEEISRKWRCPIDVQLRLKDNCLLSSLCPSLLLREQSSNFVKSYYFRYPEIRFMPRRKAEIYIRSLGSEKKLLTQKRRYRRLDNKKIVFSQD